MPDDLSLSTIQKQVEIIWKRARVNAFAHRFSSEKYKKRASELFRKQVMFGLFSILFVFFAYVATTTILNTNGWLEREAVPFVHPVVVAVILPSLPLLFTVFSVLCGAYSLYVSVMQNYGGYEKSYMTHNHNQHSFLFIAQRAREVSWPGIDEGKAASILEDLERDFQLLKARGQEPSDIEFNRANDLFEKLQSSPAGDMQSFHDSSVENSGEPDANS